MAHWEFQKGRLSRRRAASKEPKPRIVVCCEGTNTEPQYFKGLASSFGNSLVTVEVHKGQGVPISVVESACQQYDVLKKAANKSKDSFDAFFEVWAVFDVDDHKRVPDAKQNAKAKGVRVACSNPCFEIWLLYHFEDCHRPYHRHDLQKYLATKLHGYDPKGGKSISFNKLKDGVVDALRHAEKGLTARRADGCDEGNPSSSVGLLAQAIIDHGKGSGTS